MKLINENIVANVRRFDRRPLTRQCGETCVSAEIRPCELVFVSGIDQRLRLWPVWHRLTRMKPMAAFCGRAKLHLLAKSACHFARRIKRDVARLRHFWRFGVAASRVCEKPKWRGGAEKYGRGDDGDAYRRAASSA